MGGASLPQQQREKGVVHMANPEQNNIFQDFLAGKGGRRDFVC